MESTEKSSKAPPSISATATLAAGCFWGVEHFYRQLPGVISVTSGYTGGLSGAESSADSNASSSRGQGPTYREVCTGTTGHAEAVEIIFDPSVVTFPSLLEPFWERHDPTTLNRQGPDIGSQYRSAIFFHTPEQQREAEASRAAAQKRFPRPIVTEITPASRFWPAEEVHQRYFEKHGAHGCSWSRE